MFQRFNQPTLVILSVLSRVRRCCRIGPEGSIDVEGDTSNWPRFLNACIIPGGARDNH